MSHLRLDNVPYSPGQAIVISRGYVMRSRVWIFRDLPAYPVFLSPVDNVCH